MARRLFFVASTGGHLEELYRLRLSLMSTGPAAAQPTVYSATWITFDSPQSRSLLAEESDVIYVRRVGSRGYLDLIRNLVPAMRLLRRLRPEGVYSTGAGIALTFLPFAWLVGAHATYIESAARTSGPSLTGRLLSVFPWVRLRTQYQMWASRRWHYAGSVFDGYAPVGAEQERPIRRVVVTLGTQEGYPFVSLVKRMQEIVPTGVEVRWQIGEGFPPELRPAGAREMISRAELSEWVHSSDVVVTHAGVGSALTLLDAGRLPVLVPRSASRNEHVDEHQQLIANELTVRGLAISAAPDELLWDDLVQSAGVEMRRVGATPV